MFCIIDEFHVLTLCWSCCVYFVIVDGTIVDIAPNGVLGVTGSTFEQHLQRGKCCVQPVLFQFWK